MSDVEKPEHLKIKLFRTAEHKCSYLPEKQSRTLFLDPELDYSATLYEELTHSGFRRSGKHLYRPDCKTCQSCIPSRIPISDFQLKRKHRRVLNRNQDIKLDIQQAEYRAEDYALFEKYVNLRHADGDMYPASVASYQDFLATTNEFSRHLRFMLNDQLVALAVTDDIESGLSAIYTFFDPEMNDRSLGVFAILSQIQVCADQQLPYLYLGYWVPGCRKMEYKTQYTPIELLINGQWLRLENSL